MYLTRSAGKTRCQDTGPLPCPCLLQRLTLPAATQGAARLPSNA